jgi:DNA-binding CsgD family transcriptional regulator
MEEHFAAADALLARLLPLARSLGLELGAAMVSVVTGALRWRQGHWDQAFLFASEPLESRQLPHVSQAWGQASQAHLLAPTGRIAETEALVDEALASPPVQGSALIRSWALAARGHLRLAQGDHGSARDIFGTVAASVEVLGLAQPSFFLWHGDYIEALLRCGDVVEAERVVVELETSPAAQRLSWCRGIVARARGELTNDADEAAVLFAQSLDTFATVGYPFEVARTHLALGRSLLRREADATTSFAKARRIFASLGAGLWLAVVDGLVDGSGFARATIETDVSNPPWSSVLTNAEHRVALAVGSGRTNVEVAAELYLSVRTVEFHLGSVYRKLNLKNRASLIARLAEEMHIR